MTRVTIAAVLRWVHVGGVLAALALPARAQQPAVVESEPSQEPAGEPVVLRGDTLFTLHQGLGPFTVDERARAIERRLEDFIRDPSLEGPDVTIEEEAGAWHIGTGDMRLLTLTAADADAAGTTPDQLARDYALRIEVALRREIEAVSPTRIALGALYALIATLLLIAILRAISRTFPAINRWIERDMAKYVPAFRFQQLELVRADRVSRALLILSRVARLVLTLALLYLYLPLVLSFFPWTRRFSGEIVGWVVRPLTQILAGMVSYLPSLFTILVIVGVTYYSIKLVKQFFLAIESGTLVFEGFYSEWARPTYTIARFLIIALSVIMVWPYLPRSDSDAFRGVAAFLGLLITFGSAGMIANVVGGVMLTYMRAFRVGDRVRIGDTMGDVIEQNLLVTRVRTSKMVEVTIPNAQVLGAHIDNWSPAARAGGVVLHTEVTIGYDVDWRQVQELLLSAARGVPGLLADPAPFVLVSALNDHHVGYELNAYTDTPNTMARTYAQLHRSILDVFNEAGVEILSPVYEAGRDGNPSTIPEQYRASGQPR